MSFMNANLWTRLFALVGLVLAGGDAVAAVNVTGPDGTVVATVETSLGNLNYYVKYRGVTVIETSALGITVNGTNMGIGAAISVVLLGAISVMRRAGAVSSQKP